MSSSISAEGLLSLPEEVLESVILYLKPTDVASVYQTSRVLRNLVTSSSVIQYQNLLALRGYVDVPARREVPLASRTSEGGGEGARGSTARGSNGDVEMPSRDTSPAKTPFQRAMKSPHTGRPRPTLPTVQLAPWHVEPPRTRRDESALTLPEKNLVLGARERRWDTLTPAQSRLFNVKGANSVYELQEGILLMCEEFTGELRPRAIRLIPLPTVSDPDLEDPATHVKAKKMPFLVADLTMDPTQDLIVVSEYDPAPSRPDRNAPAHKYHLLAMSTFEPHPLAAEATLEFPPARVITDGPRQLIQVMGDTLVAHGSREGLNVVALQGTHAVVANDSEEEIVAWNWKTREVIARLHLGRTSAPCTFCMLTPTTVAVARPSVISQDWDHGPERPPLEFIAPPAIVILSFAQPPGEKVKIEQPLEGDEDDGTTPRAVELTRLLIPELSAGSSLDHFHMRPDPAFPPADPNGPTLGRGKPFTQDPVRGVVAIELSLSDESMRPQEYEMFILREKLVEMANEAEERLRESWEAGEEFEAVELSWSEWGEEHARLMPQVQQQRRRWVCSCAGYRFASLVKYDSTFGGEPWLAPEVEDPDEPVKFPRHMVHLVVHDFNPYTVARDRVELSRQNPEAQAKSSWVVKAEVDPDAQAGAVGALADEYTITVWDQPTRVPAGSVWEEDVVSRLPFRTIRRGLRTGNTSPPSGVMMDDQRIMTIRSGERDLRHNITVLCM